MVFFVLPLAALSIAPACSSSSSPPAASDAGFSTGDSSSGSNATSIGTGTIQGTGSFTVSTAKVSDPGPFNGKPRLLVELSNDPGCGRGRACTSYEELWLRLSGPSGASSLGPGEYTVIVPQDGGVAGGVEVNLDTTTGTPNSCDLNTDLAHQGTVTLDTVSETEVKGSFSVDIESGMSTNTLTGTFDALACP